MIIILILLTVLAAIVGFKTNDDYCGLAFISFTAVATLIVIDIAVIVFICINYTEGLTATNKIKMYEEENAKIEEKVNVLVFNYMEYENKTLKDFKIDNSMLLVSLYPELKSNKLIEEQIKIYNSNNKKIKELKEKEIDIRISKWLLYFGG